MVSSKANFHKLFRFQFSSDHCRTTKSVAFRSERSTVWNNWRQCEFHLVLICWWHHWAEVDVCLWIWLHYLYEATQSFCWLLRHCLNPGVLKVRTSVQNPDRQRVPVDRRGPPVSANKAEKRCLEVAGKFWMWAPEYIVLGPPCLNPFSRGQRAVRIFPHGYPSSTRVIHVCRFFFVSVTSPRIPWTAIVTWRGCQAGWEVRRASSTSRDVCIQIDIEVWKSPNWSRPTSSAKVSWLQITANDRWYLL